jgi:multiple sugar transport system substrate-binding protein
VCRWCPITTRRPHKNPGLAKAFVKFVVESKRYAEYIKGANGRWFPAFKDVAAADPYHSKSPANSQVYAENVWGKAMDRTIEDKWSSEKAADEAIARVKTIVAQWR